MTSSIMIYTDNVDVTLLYSWKGQQHMTSKGSGKKKEKILKRKKKEENPF